MPDLLVPLYRLPARAEIEASLKTPTVLIRRANTFELTKVRDFITTHFSVQWADEAAAAFARQPVTCFLAIEDRTVIGFAAYESTRRNYFGPTGVTESHRGQGIGKALFLASMWGLRDMGYAYAIIGAAGPVEFYQKTAGAIVIPDSVPGIYTDLLK